MEATIHSNVLKKQMSFEVFGNSMNDGTLYSIITGDILSGVELPLKNCISEFKKSNIFVIANTAGRLFVTEIHDYIEETNEIICHIRNSSTGNNYFNLKIDSIERIYSIEAIARSFEKDHY